ncbi:G-protein coupled receptor [Mactra antiquata]
MNHTADIEPFTSEGLQTFSLWYSQWHGIVSLTICVIGIPLNIINIIVLTRRQMETPINCILLWLAVADIATMMSYVPFAVHFYCEFSAYSISSEKNSWGWMNFLLVYINFSSTTHTISIWLAVALAMFRHHHVHSPSTGSITQVRRLVRARFIVFIIVAMSVVFMIPNYLSHKLREVRFRDNTTGYVFQDWELGSGKIKPIKVISLLTYSILAKIIPCVLIIVYGGLLLQTLKNTMKKRRRLTGTRHGPDPSRTTIMLLVVIVLFLVTELPQGILILCSLYMEKFFDNIYIPLGDVMDIIALINNGVNFVLYCTMSHEFRRTFINLFCAFAQQQSRRGSNVSSNIFKHRLHTTMITDIQIKSV